MKREITPEQKIKVIRKLAEAIKRNKIKFAEEGYYEYNRKQMQVTHKDQDNIQRERNAKTCER